MTEVTGPHALFDIRGQTAVVTGGSGVLGRVLARALGAAGARVAVLGRRAEPCAAVADEIIAAGGEALGVACDVRQRASIERAAQRISEVFGPVDILVNGAGGNVPEATISADRPFFTLEAQVMEDVLGANLTGTIQCCQIFGAGMAARGTGCILTIASLSGLQPLTRVVAYSAAKAAVINFTQWLAVHMAQEYSPAIRVNALAPGFFLTDQNRYLLVDAATGAWTARGQAIIAHTPAGRMGEPEELVGTMLWLVSPAARFVTGIVVPVDGGFTATSGV